MPPARLSLIAVVVATLVHSGVAAIAANDLAVPNRPNSLKFAAFGDNGTGEGPEYDIAAEMAAWHQQFAFDMVIMLGDNLYGSQKPADFVQKFERPYKPLLDAGVKFYASLGNHDDPKSDMAYAPFNMNGQRYFSFVRNNVRFLVLDSNSMDPAQLAWLEHQLAEAAEPWKIAYFHHPLYSDGGRHGSEHELRVTLEPLFIKYGVNVVYSGHDHIYERVKPQHGINYFVSGSGGQLRAGNLKRSDLTAAGFDRDRTFMLNELDGDDLYFQVVSRTGQTVDQGVIHRGRQPS
jgi:predicted MPP superfamily phosphohydrolase